MTQQQRHIGRFIDLGIDEKILAVLSRKGFTAPTPIQHQVISSAIEGKDIVGVAQTGTGKTLAFGIPMIQRLQHIGGQGLVLVPTRELALQVEQSLAEIARACGFRIAVIIGGTRQRAQEQALRNRPQIVVATPGRLADLMNQGVYNLNAVTIVALDEADRMLDIGFLPQIRRILQTVRKERQTLLFSATMPRTISELAASFMRMPIRIEIAPQGTAAENVEQEVFIIQRIDKMRLLDSLLDQYAQEKILIFSRTKHGAKKIARDIRDMGLTAAEIHSNRSQSQRRIALDGFVNGRFRILVATDIAARGIDVKDIGVVINFDLPDNSEDYVHRIGRTGRAGKFGKAISFVTPAERFDIRKIEKLIRKSLPILALPQLPPERERKFVPRQHQAFGERPFTERRHGRGGFSNSNRRSRFSRSRRQNSARPSRAF